MSQTPRGIFFGTLFISLGLTAQFLAPASPDYAFPLLPESVLLAIIGVYFSWAFKNATGAENGSSLSLRGSERAWLFALLGVLMLWMAPRLGLTFVENGLGPCRHAAPSFITRGECFVQAAFVQNYGIRQFITLLMALYAGALAALATRFNTQNWKIFAYAIVFVSLAHVIIGFVTHAKGELQLLPKWIMVNSFGMERFTFVIPNPSWVWPQLAPALAWSLWLALDAKKLTRFIAFLSACAVSIAIVMTHQRGGLLLLVVLWGIFLTRLVWNFLHNKTQNLKAKFSFAAAWIIGVVLGARYLLHWATEAAGRGTFHDDNRWTMWKVALKGLMEQSPVWGFGYASWYSKFRDIAVSAGVPGLSFDTAHSLWVQLLFEHGFIGFLFISVVIIGAVLLAWRNARRLPHGTHLIALHAAGFLCCSIVQEVDYIRPVFITHALTWGALLGLPYYLNANETLPERKLAYFIVRPSAATPKQLWHTRFAMRLIGIEGLVIAMLCLLWFGRGAFGFEGQANSNGPMARWLGAQASIPVFGPEEFWLFETDFRNKQGSIQFDSGSSHFLKIQATPQDFVYLPLQAGGRLIPQRYVIEAEPTVDDAVRQITANIVYPPRVGNGLLPLVLTRGASRPEQNEGSSWIECSQNCQIALDSKFLAGAQLEVRSIASATGSSTATWELARIDEPTVSFDSLKIDAASKRTGTLGSTNPLAAFTEPELTSPQSRWTFLSLSSINNGTKIRVTLRK